MRRRIPLLVLVSALPALLLSGCGKSVRKPVQEILSKDGCFRALIHLDEGSAVIGGNWYAVLIEEAHPRWFDPPTMRGSEACTLQGRGTVSLRWSGPRELVVTCTNCDRREFFIDRRAWKGVTIKYEFERTPKPQASTQ